MNRNKITTAVSIILLPLIFAGCAKTDKPVNKEKEAVKKEGLILTSEKLTNFEGLADMIKEERIPDQAIICTVGDDAINVGDYKLNFRYKQDQAKQLLQSSPAARAAILREANQLGFKLSDREKKDLLDAALEKGGTELEKQFKSGKLNKADFEKDVLDMGVVLKALNTRIEQNLLTEIINNSLLVDAARKRGLGKIAFNKYVEVKHSDQYQKYLDITHLTPNQVKDQILEEILVDLMKKEIVKNADIGDSQVYEFYKQNKENFKHDGRVKWSQILIADPEQDFGAITTVATEVDRKYPKLSAKEKLAKVKELKEEKKKKAMDLVKQAKSGIDFGKLANNNTEDIPARASRTGGNMGYADLNQLSQNQIFKNVSSALETMTAGEIYPKPIKSVVGWHIIKLNEKQKSGYISFDEIKEEIKHSLAQQNSEFAVRAWIIKQRETVPVKISKRFEKFLTKANKIDNGPQENRSQNDNNSAPEEKKIQ